MQEPLDAAALILLSADKKEVLWARRNPELRFLGGFHGFTGGKVEPDDTSCDVRNEPDAEKRSLIACAVRETFEEVGVLLVRNGEKLTKGQRRSLHDDLVSGREQFSAILDHWDLWIDAEDLTYTGEWTTPDFSPIRFRTHFFAAVCPDKQTPYQAITELVDIEFTAPGDALGRWSSAGVLIAPPVLFAVEELERHSGSEIRLEVAASALRKRSARFDGMVHQMEMNSRLILLPLRTKTLPPATHTNCFIVGKNRFVVIDAASPDPSEHEKLFSVVDPMVEGGAVCEAILVSHLHPDHFGGESALKEHLFEKFGIDVPVTGHRLTAEALDGKVRFDEILDSDHSYTLQDADGTEFALDVLHTPGHARGHLCFYDRGYGFLLSMDNVLGAGSVLIAPPEGNMTDYLASLERMRDLPGLNFLCGSHGQAVSDARGKIGEYIAHRLEREREVAEAMNGGASTAEEVARAVYKDLDPALFPLAVRSAEAHIERLNELGGSAAA